MKRIGDPRSPRAALAALLACGITSLASASDARRIPVELYWGKAIAKRFDDPPLKLAPLSFEIPSMPATAILGVSPDEVASPTSLKEAYSTILNAVDRDGNFKSGFAMAFTPLYMSRLTLADYLEKPTSQRNWLNSQFSLAIVKGTSETDKSIKAGLGLVIPLIETNDLRADQALIDATSAMWSKAFSETAGIAQLEGETPDQWAARVQKISLSNAHEKIDKFVADTIRARVPGPSLSLVLGSSYADPAGTTENLKYTGGGAWLLYSKGFAAGGSPGRIVLLARARDRETVVDKATGAAFRQDSSAAGFRVQFSSDRTGFMLESLFERRRIEGQKRREVWIVQGGYEMKVTDQQWLILTLGTNEGPKGDRHVRFGLSMSFDLSKSRAYGN